MRLRRLLPAALVLSVVVLPTVCLCQFVPGQAALGPHFLFLPAAHGQAQDVLSDDQLAELALTTGQAVSVADDGTVTLGSGDGSAPIAGTGCRLGQHNAAAVEQSPVLNAIMPAPPASGPPDHATRAVPAPAPDHTPPFLAPPKRPPKAA